MATEQEAVYMIFSVENKDLQVDFVSLLFVELKKRTYIISQ